MHGRRRRSWFHVEGSLGGLRYQARFGLFDLRDLTEQNQRLLALPVQDSTRAFAIQVWESEGGALLHSKY